MNSNGAVAITGIGAITPYGDADDLLAGMVECRSCLEKLSVFDTDIDPIPMVGQIRQALDVESRAGYRLSRTDMLAVLASRKAAAQAALEADDLARAGVVIATTVGGLPEIRPEISRDPRGYYRRFGFPVSYQHGHVADVIGAYLGLHGPRLGVSVACASGSMAIALAARMILDGTAPVMLAGGSEALCWFTLSGFHALQALDPKPCRPFDRERNGLNIGEGAAVLVLEDAARARERNASILAILCGWGMTNDAYHMTAPDEEGRGLAASINGALKMANIEPGRVGYVNAHGTGTFLNDVSEAKAYESVFGTRSSPIPVSSSKSYFGHNLGAAGALEAVVTILSLRTQTLFPTLRLENPIESPGIDWLMGAIRRAPLSFAVSASAGFGGSNTSLLLGLDE